MYETAKGYAEQAANNTLKDRPMSRIESDVENVKRMKDIVENTTSRIIRHAHTLGYFQPPQDGAKTAAPTPVVTTPVVTTLADALNELDRAIGHCSGALNVFD